MTGFVLIRTVIVLNMIGVFLHMTRFGLTTNQFILIKLVTVQCSGPVYSEGVTGSRRRPVSIT